MKARKIMFKVIYSDTNLQWIVRRFPQTSSNVPFRHKFLGEKTSFGCCVSQYCTACFIFASDQKWRPRRMSFRSQERWKSLGAKSGEYRGWGGTYSFTSWVSFTVWPSVCGRTSSSCKHIPGRRQTAAFCSNCRLKLIPNHPTAQYGIYHWRNLFFRHLLIF